MVRLVGAACQARSYNFPTTHYPFRGLDPKYEGVIQSWLGENIVYMYCMYR